MDSPDKTSSGYIEGKNEIEVAGLRLKSGIDEDQEKFKSSVSNSSTPEPVCVISERNNSRFLGELCGPEGL
jgi:hypothetical protein